MKSLPIKNRKTNVLYLLILVSFISFNTYAQRSVRIGYIDTEYILQNVPEFNEASSQLNTKIEKWKSEIETRLTDLDQRKKQLNSEGILLTKELIEERQEEIDIEENEISAYQQKRFGPGGDLVIQRRQLMQPIQDQIFNAVQEIASKGKYDFIFDKSADVVMLYSADRYNISDRVLSLITRTSNRKQATSRKERREAEESLEEDIEAATAPTTNSQEDRAKAIADRKAQRLKENEDWKAERAAKRQALKEKKEKVAADRAKAREAKINAKKAKAEEKTEPSDSKNETSTKEETSSKDKEGIKKLTPKEARQKALDEKKKKILEDRAKKAEEAAKIKKVKTEKGKTTKALSSREARKKALEEKKKKILEDRKKAAKVKDSTSNKNNN